MNNQPVPSPTEIDILVGKERLRQAKLSFNLAFTATAISFTISLIGGGLMLSSKAEEGTISCVVGLISSTGCLKFAKDFNDRLDKIQHPE